MISESEIQNNKKEIEQALRSTGRNGIEGVIRFLEDGDFFNMPSSDRNHHNWRGGLAQHVLEVMHYALDAYPKLPKDSPASTIARVIGVDSSASDNTKLSWLLTDSRQLTYPESTVFFALRTDVNDGHRYIDDLYRAGVRYFVVDQDIKAYRYREATFWRVDDSLRALQSLGAYVRDNHYSRATVVGITGSRGKTVVKELIYLAMSHDYEMSIEFKTIRSPRSYNSQIGVPLSVWEVEYHTNIAIFEAGISRPGEMARLEQIIKPEIGVFTSLTDEHADGFESLEQKAYEKALLFRHCGTVYVGADSPGSDIMMAAVAKVNPEAQIVPVEGGDKGLALAVVQCLLSRTMLDADCVPDPPEHLLRGGGQLVDGMYYFDRVKRFVDRASENISSRIVATDTLKDCTVVYDSFTNDLRSLYDGYKLEPVARLVSTIISIKQWGPGVTIGYGGRGVIADDAVIATVPIGYADGLDRHLSNHNAYVLVNGHRCDIVGNICMDQCMVDITGTGAQIGDTVEIFGPSAPIERLSDTLGSIPYEILTSISPRVKRIYFRD